MQTERISKIGKDAFQKEVFESAMPVVVDFYADWCGPCKMVSPVLENLSTEYDGRVKFVKLNVDDDPDIASRFGIMSIPTVVFVSNGKVRDVVIGAVSAASYKQKVEETFKAQAASA
jgi:thioredoxin 1